MAPSRCDRPSLKYKVKALINGLPKVMKVPESNSLRYKQKSHLNLEKRDFSTSSCFLLTIWPPKWPLTMSNMTFMIGGGGRAFGRCYATYFSLPNNRAGGKISQILVNFRGKKWCRMDLSYF